MKGTVLHKENWGQGEGSVDKDVCCQALRTTLGIHMVEGEGEKQLLTYLYVEQ